MRLLTVSLFWLGAFICALPAEETYVAFRADLPAGAACTIDARELHPTQFALGWREVVYKRKLIEEKTPAKAVVYLKEKDVPIVIGPGGVPYMADGHHTMRALIESSRADKTAYGHIHANWSALPVEEFWARMQAENCAYLKDGAGRPAPASALPGKLTDLQRDPWRGLAWGVMKAGGFDEKKGVFFQEFRWGDYFRDKVSWDDADDAAFARAVREACALAHEPAAAHLPGYTPAPTLVGR